MADEQRLNIDISNYLKLKAEGSVRIIKVNGVAQYAQRRYDPVTGAPIPVLVALRREDVEQQRKLISGVVDALNAVLADIDAAVEV